MEQKKSAKSKRMWSVIIDIHVMGKEGVRYGKSKRMRDKDYLMQYCHTQVTKFFKKGNMLHIREGKREYVYEASRIEMIQIREHKRVGVQ